MMTLSETILLAYARNFPLRRGKFRLVERLWRSCLKNGATERVANLRYGNYTMECDIRKMLQRQFYFFGTYFLEESVLYLWSKHAKQSKVILDVGANAGIFSLAAAASNPTAIIHAFEPTPEIVSHLRRTITRNGLERRIQIHECAIAEKSGSASLNFFFGETLDNEGMNFVADQARGSESISIELLTLDEFCTREGFTVIDLLKIDVQGGEPKVLTGAVSLLKRKAIRTIFLELNWDKKEGRECPATKVIKILTDAGYSFADPKGKGDFRSSGPWLRSKTDIIATVP